MIRAMGLAAAAALSLSSGAMAGLTLQLDLNALAIQVQDGSGANSAFGGTSHTGKVVLDKGAFGTLFAVSLQSLPNGPFVNQGFSGTLFDVDGEILLSGGAVVGGFLDVFINGGTDSYTAKIVNGQGSVKPSLIGGGFTIDGLTFAGMFSDATFGNVDVSQFFNAQGANGLPGSFLQFNFDPNASGAGFADIDAFVTVPLPPAAWAGMATLAGVMGLGYLRRRK